MSTPVLFALALITFYVGITLTFLEKDDSVDAPLPALARVPIQQAAR
ncbi:hypothetical protein OKA05_01735 [Luteolibacter arcticus]|uniref:Uncharacterized protein n=1 Tax=Luteolibacter arcticus TaxID=1581411 RepID=A0ABT3GCW6_9BACT|nr:hypothetical protein [Luteolibacter arcticus]MCW1921253.1 hypothetical protein [Luteolibacter arcticus]